MKRRYLALYGGPIGDALVMIHIGRTLAANVPGAVLEMISVRENAFIRELCCDLPFIQYREMPKHSLSSWFALPALMLRLHYSIAYEPIAYPISLWWRIILWCARRRAGSVELRYQTQGYEKPVPHGVLQRAYDCAHQNLFDTPKTILEAWGVPAHTLPHPSLPTQPAPNVPPYLLFHFFAGALRRTIPVEHARAILEAARVTYPHHAFVLTCAQNERERAERMAEGISNIRIESGHSANELIALLCGAELVVGVTSGIILTAACLQRPLIALHCMSHGKAFMPDFSENTTILAALNECRCRPGDGSQCPIVTDDGSVYRCLYFIPTEEILEAMKKKLPEA